MPDDKKPFLDRMTPAGRETTPVGYRFFDTPNLEITERMRTAPSDWYHAVGFACFSFYKPVSRCRRHDEP